MKLALVGQSYTTRSVAASAQSCINLYPELVEDPQERSKNKATLYQIPGRHKLADYTGQQTYCIWTGQSSGGQWRTFIVVSSVSGRDLVELNSSGGEISRHNFTALDDGLPAQIFANGTQLLVISCGLAFVDDGSGPVPCVFDNFFGTVDTSGTAVVLDGPAPGTVLLGFVTDGSWNGAPIIINGVTYTISSVTDANNLVLTSTAGTQTAVLAEKDGTDPVTALTGAYLDGYGIVQRPQGGSPDLGRQFNISAILDFSSWSSLDFANAEAEPSYIMQLWVDNEQLYTFKGSSFQVWQNTGSGVGGFPFSNVEGAMAKFGSVSRWGNVSLGGKVYMLGSDGSGWTSAYVLNGFTPVRISGHAQEETWQKAGSGLNAIAYAYTEEGHSFYVVNFGGGQCWAFDPETGSWASRASWNGSTFGAYPTLYHAFNPAWGTSGYHLTAGGPLLDGSIYISSVDYYDDNGHDIAWQRAIPYVYNEAKLQFFGRMNLETQTGMVPSGAAPFVVRDYSDDRGQTFSGAQSASLGVHAAYSLLVYWPTGGSSRNRVWRFTGYGQNFVALIDLDCEIDLGAV